MLKNENILVIGGTGSLGTILIENFYKDNNVSVLSRDATKHWSLKQKYPGVHFYMGDIVDQKSIDESLLFSKPSIVIIAAALKHIDVCELNSEKSIDVNTLGVLNCLKSICSSKVCPKTVIFVSTDKACNPTSTYGLCKALAEKIVIDYALRYSEISNVRFTLVRYGNVLTSNGSIIPLLQKKVKETDTLQLTDVEMTRFYMTLQDSVDLIVKAILTGKNGELFIPRIKSMKIKDLLELFAEKYDKQIEVVGIRAGEKIHEELLSENEASRTIERDGIFIVQPYGGYRGDPICFNNYKTYSSAAFIENKHTLKQYLNKLHLI